MFKCLHHANSAELWEWSSLKGVKPLEAVRNISNRNK